MTPRTIPPLIRVLAPAITLALLLSACGGSPGDVSEAGEGTPSETEETSEENETAAEVPGRSSFGDPGILIAECAGGNDGTLGFNLTLFSDEDGGALHEAAFEPRLASHAESDFLSHGRAAQEGADISLAEPCGDDNKMYFPERGMVVGSITENVNGNNVTGFGVLHENGTFTTLSPDQEVSDFATPINYLHPIADSSGDRILFVQDDGENKTAQAMDLENGKITDFGPCDPTQCTRFTVRTGLDSAVFDETGVRDIVPVLDGSALIGGTNTRVVEFYDLGDQTGADLIDLMELTGRNDLLGERGPQVNLETEGRIQAIDDNTLLIADNVMSVWEFTADTFQDYEAENEDTLQYSREALPVTRTLVPEGPRENSDPHVSPDGTRIIFRSEAEAGGSTWYQVPVDGSSEPEEFPGLPIERFQEIIAWQ
ncbi:hypothetical protein ACIQFP_25695 [Nocardiopsis alba]|uniref:hypothetical protein n=1 Tax=Nocardiopsis alba TaxID=53437 RepID=UPI0037F4C7D0